MTYNEMMLERALVEVRDAHNRMKESKAKGHKFMVALHANVASAYWSCARHWRRRVMSDHSAHVEAWRKDQTKDLGK